MDELVPKWAYRIGTPLFRNMIYIHFPNMTDTPFIFLHTCEDTRTTLFRDSYIKEDGKCPGCKLFIGTPKKLEVMRALKELTG